MLCRHHQQQATDFIDERGWAMAILCASCGIVLAIERP